MCGRRPTRLSTGQFAKRFSSTSCTRRERDGDELPYYTFICTACHSRLWFGSSIADRDKDRVCTKCGGELRRIGDGGNGLVGGGRPEWIPALDPPPHRPGITMRGITIENCGTGVRMSGGHADIDGMRIIDTPTGFDLSNGATVDMRDVSHEFTKRNGRLGGPAPPMTTLDLKQQ